MQTALSGHDETSIKNWIRLLSIWPPSNAAKKKEFQSRLRNEMDGFVCVADPPASLLVPELLELYPDAKVLVTVRDKEKWAQSWEAILKLIIPFWVSRMLYFWVPTVRYLPVLWSLFPTIFTARHGETMTDKASIYRIHDRHHEWLREVVPADKLFFVDVKEGWAPLCRALDVPVPEGVEYPRLNDGKDMEDLFKAFAVEGLKGWGMVLGAVVVGMVGVGWWLWR